MTAPTAPTPPETYTPPAGSTAEGKAADRETLKTFLTRHRDAIVGATSNKISPDRILKVALLAATKQPKLMDAKMDKLSVLRAVMEAASLGLEVGSALGEAYLVPFNNSQRRCMECQMIIGYRGIVSLARRSGSITGVDARPVFEGEQFEPHFGTDPRIVHVPSFSIPRTYETLRAVYVVWHLSAAAGGGVQFDIMSKPEVDAVRARSKASTSGPWVTDYIEMAKKTVTKRGAKMVPMSVELADALDDDTQREFGDLDLGTITEEGPKPTTEVGNGAGALLKAKVGKIISAEDTESARVAVLRAKAEEGTATDDDLEEIRLYNDEHPGQPGA